MFKDGHKHTSRDACMCIASQPLSVKWWSRLTSLLVFIWTICGTHVCSTGYLGQSGWMLDVYRWASMWDYDHLNSTSIALGLGFPTTAFLKYKINSFWIAESPTCNIYNFYHWQKQLQKTAGDLHKMVFNLMANVRLIVCMSCLWTRPVLLLLTNH